MPRPLVARSAIHQVTGPCTPASEQRPHPRSKASCHRWRTPVPDWCPTSPAGESIAVKFQVTIPVSTLVGNQRLPELDRSLPLSGLR